MKQLYECTLEGFFLGQFYKVGARAHFYPAQVAADGHRWAMVSAKADTAAPASAPGAAGRKGRR